ncbi:MAG TPA: sigma-70 family RNA polymerase sigma factor [Gemmatimonadaceae bacterium]
MNTLINCNLRLVVSVVKPFTRGRFDVQDLVSPGSEGLMVAARRYDWKVGVPFANYASIWIKQRVLKYIAENGGVVRIPHYRAAIVNKVVRENARLKQALGREPALDELWQRMQEIDPKCTHAEVEEVFRLLQPAMELDAPMKKDGDDSATFGSYFGESPAEAEERTTQQLHKIDLERAVDDALALLSEREQLVITLNFGLKGNRAMDLEQIAHCIGVTRERARQIRSAALRKLQEAEGLARYVA